MLVFVQDMMGTPVPYSAGSPAAQTYRALICWDGTWAGCADVLVTISMLQK